MCPNDDEEQPQPLTPGPLSGPPQDPLGLPKGEPEGPTVRRRCSITFDLAPSVRLAFFERTRREGRKVNRTIEALIRRYLGLRD